MTTSRSSGTEALGACLRELLTVLRSRVLLAVVLIVAASLSEGLGLLLLIPLLAVAGFADADVSPLFVRVGSWLAALGIPTTLLPLLGLFVVVVSARALLARWQAVNAAALQERFQHHLRLRLHRAVVYARYEYLTRLRPADILHALTEETGRVGLLLHAVLTLVADVVVTALLVGFALRVSWPTTAVAAVSGLVLFAALWARTRRSQVVGERTTVMGARLVGAAAEHLAGLKVAKSYHAEAAHEAAFAALSNGVQAVGVDASRAYADVTVRFQLASALLACVVVYVALAQLALPPSELLLLVILFGRLVPRFRSLQYWVQTLLTALPAYGRIQQLTSAAEREAAGVERVSSEGLVTGEVCFDQVGFRYRSREQGGEVREVSFRVAPGETVAIIGPSGAGKSTVADLMTGLLRPDSGQVRVAGRLAYVDQDTFLFNDTVRSNVAWVQPEAADDALWRVLTAARAAEFVRRLPQGLDTVVGDRGVQLSGGERQRLALARALLTAPDVLLLDEATSALDAENEAAIHEALQQLHGQVTVVMITHRLASIDGVDRVFRMASGRLERA